MSRPYRALDDLLRIPGALPRAGMYSPFRAGKETRWIAFKSISLFHLYSSLFCIRLSVAA